MEVNVLVAVVLFAFSTAAQSDRITARQAKDHAGEAETVCGKVISARYASRSKGQPTFLNLDEPYPNEIFTIVIWGENRPKFGTPESKYADDKVCVTEMGPPRIWERQTTTQNRPKQTAISPGKRASPGQRHFQVVRPAGSAASAQG